MIYVGATRYPGVFEDLADELAIIRSDLNRQRKRENPKYARGNQDHAIEYLGILGELVVRDVMRLRRIPYTHGKLIDENPNAEPDITFRGDNYDIKTSRFSAPEFLVNAEAHTKHKANNYIFVRVEDFMAYFYTAPWSEVDQWEIKRSKWTDVRFFPVPITLKNDWLWPWWEKPQA